MCSHVGRYLTNSSTACFVLTGERKQLSVFEEALTGLCIDIQLLLRFTPFLLFKTLLVKRPKSVLN